MTRAIIYLIGADGRTLKLYCNHDSYIRQGLGEDLHRSSDSSQSFSSRSSMRQDNTCARERKVAPAALLMSLERRSYC